MSLPISPVYKPMEAKAATELPTGNHWQYEPKWDGFRCLAFRDGERIELQSKTGRPLTRYFPDIVHALKSLKAQRFVIDGELVISEDGALRFRASSGADESIIQTRNGTYSQTSGCLSHL